MRFLSRKLDSRSGDALNIESTSDVSDGRRHALMIGIRRSGPLVATSMAVALLGASLVIGLYVRDSMRELTRQSLRSILSANVTALEMWLSETRGDAARMLSSEPTDLAARELLDKVAERTAWTFSDVRDEAAYQTLLKEVSTEGYLGWVVMDRGGRVVASDKSALVGQTLAVPGDAWGRLTRRMTTVSRPFPSPVPLGDQGPLSLPDPALMCAMAPITDGARTFGGFALLMDPLGRFTELLSVARTGGSGETYAFDREGTLLSQSRFEHHLRIAGLLDSDPLVTSPLRVTVRDPGHDLTTGAYMSIPARTATTHPDGRSGDPRCDR